MHAEQCGVTGMASRRVKRSKGSEGHQRGKKAKGKQPRYIPNRDRSLASRNAPRVRSTGTSASRQPQEVSLGFPPADAEADHIGRMPLGPDEVERLRSLLHQRHKTTLNLLRRVTTAESEVVTARMISPELAERGTDRAMEMLLIQEEAKELAEIDAIEAALKRMRSGFYGICTACGERISYRRLLALPEATRCIRCEKGRNQRGLTPDV